MLMGNRRGVGALGLGDAPSQLVWDNNQQRFVTSPNAIPTGCWDASRSTFAPIPASGCNSQILYTNDGVLPGSVSSTNTVAGTTGGKVVSGVLTPPTGGAFTPDIMLGSFDATAFVKSYWPWLLGGVGAIVLLTTV